MRILYISRSLPYDGVPHAGGKTFNYYIKGMASHPSNEVTLIAFCSQEVFEHCDCGHYGIKCYPVISQSKNNLKSKIERVNFFGKYLGMFTSDVVRKFKGVIKQLQSSGYAPDIVLFEWTQTSMLYRIVVEIFPRAKYAVTEHDVYFQGLERKLNSERKIFNRFYRHIKYIVTKRQECSVLSKMDLVFVQNSKDEKLLKDNGIFNTKIIVPYYDQYKIGKYDPDGQNVCFFGAMSREENYKSAIWFIEKVMPHVKNADFKFIVLGSRPPEVLKKYESERIIVTGFVDDITPYLKNTKVAVLPLVLGAGIKVKVLEFAAAGIPVITNQIGIEGIPLVKGKEYLHCEGAEAYIEALDKIFSGEIDLAKMSIACRKRIALDFNLQTSLDQYCRWIVELCWQSVPNK